MKGTFSRTYRVKVPCMRSGPGESGDEEGAEVGVGDRGRRRGEAGPGIEEAELH